MSELIYAIEFAKHVNLPRVCEFLINLGYPLRQLHEKETCYRFEYKTLKELKENGYKQFIMKIDYYFSIHLFIYVLFF